MVSQRLKIIKNGCHGMKIVHVCTEFFPLIKTGGLADVIGALPLAQRQQGLDARLLMPGFPALMSGVSDLVTVYQSSTFAGDIRLLLGHYNQLPIYLIDAPTLYQRPGNPYMDDSMEDYSDNYLRFALLAWVSCQLAKGIDKGWQPDIVHAHDWHAGLAGAYLAESDYPARCLFTVHNLAYQGLFSYQCLDKIGLPARLFQAQGLEFYGQISYLKAGLYYADHVTTVSPTYAEEICTSAYGCGLEGILQERHLQGRLSGILNGLDDTVWNPADDLFIAHQFHPKNLANKRKNKAIFQRDCQFNVDDKALLFGVVSRITPQKGLDLILQILPELAEHNAQFVLLGRGDIEMEKAFQSLAERYPDQIKVILAYDEVLSHQIMAAADVIMVPSRFEPCGLTQLYALKYGALPLVRATGGLADTVFDCSLENLMDNTANGFVFQNPTLEALYGAVRRALALWQQPKNWQKIQRRNMQVNQSWLRAADAYSLLYQHIVSPHI
jgi:starch synthase